LLWAFAAELVENQAGPECAAARHRLFDYYLRWAVDADHSFTTLPRQIDADLVELPAGLEPPGFPENADSGMKWLRAERDVVMALTAHAAAEGWDSYAWRLASAQACALLLSNRAHDCARQSRIGLSAAKRLGDLLGQAHSHHQIGRALIYTRERETARFQLRRALRLYRGLGHLPGLTETYRDLRTLYATEGEYEAALPYGLEYVALAEQLGHLPSQTMAHTALAEVLVSLGRIAEAQEHGRRAIDMSRSLGRLRSEAAAQQVMGEVYRILGDEAASAASYERARELYDRLGYVDQLRGLVSQAEVSESKGELERARQIWTMVRLQAGGDSYYVDEAVRKIAELGVGSVR
jgi:tetratricopeptide (TPR) repeat protein